MSDETRTPNERYEYGRSLRQKAPLESHAEWSPGPERPDPVDLIESQNENRIASLVPVRRARMAVSPFTFFRGSARIMAHDLARTPVSGLRTQICGDAHLANFGAYASPERRLVFDLNDFDETLPGPWEWDIKRLAASFVLAGRHNDLGRKETRKVTEQVVRTYRKAMDELASMRLTEIWYRLVEVEKAIESIDRHKMKNKAESGIKKAKRKDSRHALDKLAEEVDGEYRIRSEPPLLVPLRDVRSQSLRDEVRATVAESFEDYKRIVPDDVGHLLRQYRPVDFALKVVGVGSVGTRCFILLLEGRDRNDPLFLQIKQASKSVLEDHLRNSRYKNPAKRVVEGQRLMQTVSDIFLGHVKSSTVGGHYYWRQLKDWKGSADVDNTTGEALHGLARMRGWVLARAHARAGDPIAIAGYLDAGKTFDRAVARFAERYADQCQRDHEAFVAEIQSGRLEAAELE